ncbi:hypothetical protein [Subdoligranulum variabile]|uniref:hypothetical protein n=1 Tax=Subdoligranulum variabile TaxID=214851 RepID=UPI0026EA328E|nr:hypothetical protein [Subdoligranulum variabile]
MRMLSWLDYKYLRSFAQGSVWAVQVKKAPCKGVFPAETVQKIVIVPENTRAQSDKTTKCVRPGAGKKERT